MLHYLKKIVISCVKFLLWFFPIKKGKIVIENFQGRGFGDNPKYISNRIMHLNLPFKLVWLVRGDVELPNGIKKVQFASIKAFYELATAEIIIDNCKSPLSSRFKKKKKQFYLQTWHGDFPLKYIEKEVEDSLWPDYVKASKADSAVTDAIISGNKFFTKILKESFWLPDTCKILEYGVPRNDIYFKGKDLKNELKSKYRFVESDKILLYAPTFRDNLSTDYYNLDFDKIRDCLYKKYGDEWKIIVRLHPGIAKKADLFSYNENIINGSVYPDPQELCFISDCLITDYSSLMADFILMKKPVYLYVPDLEKYSDKSTGRGLRDIFYKLPFHFCKTQDELEAEINTLNSDEYLIKLQEFMNKYYESFDDGHASEKVVNYLKSVISK